MKLYRATGDGDGWAVVKGAGEDTPLGGAWRPATARERLWWELTHPRFSIIWLILFVICSTIVRYILWGS